MASKRFRELRTELNRLRRHFLPKTWSRTGAYSDRVIDRARGYRVLAHAEIEYFLENVVMDKVVDCYSAWMTLKKPSYVILCLLAASVSGWQDDEIIDIDPGLPLIKPLKIKRDDDSVHRLVERAVGQYEKIVKENNGVKKISIKRLIMPVGISLSDLDQVWINSMSSFGGIRGSFAHTSRLGITNLPDPKSEKDAVDDLLKGLETLDNLVQAL